MWRDVTFSDVIRQHVAFSDVIRQHVTPRDVISRMILLLSSLLALASAAAQDQTWEQREPNLGQPPTRVNIGTVTTDGSSFSRKSRRDSDLLP